jgi:hypothetical protein
MGEGRVRVSRGMPELMSEPQAKPLDRFNLSRIY